MENQLITKEVEFNGNYLKAAQDLENGKIYVGIKWVCTGIGLTQDQGRSQVKKIQSDLVLRLGCVKFDTGVFDENNDTVAVELDYLPLWLAKISITPTMIKENPVTVEKLISYQLKAKDVLAKAFIHKDEINIDNFHIPTTLSEALQLSADLAKENEVMKPKAEQFDLYLNCNGTSSWNQTAKMLKTKRNKMLQFLRHKDVINEDNSPGSYCANKDYFIVSSYAVRMKDDKKYRLSITRVTAKGQDFLYKYLKKHIDEYSLYDTTFKSKISGGNA